MSTIVEGIKLDILLACDAQRTVYLNSHVPSIEALLGLKSLYSLLPIGEAERQNVEGPGALYWNVTSVISHLEVTGAISLNITPVTAWCDAKFVLPLIFTLRTPEVVVPGLVVSPK